MGDHRHRARGGTPRGALVTGITGQDGSYLAELLLRRGYRVVGTRRRSSVGAAGLWRLAHLLDHPRLRLVEADLTDPASLAAAWDAAQPDEVYNLAAQSFVRASFDAPVATALYDGVGVVHLLELARDAQARRGRRVRFYQASTSEQFGNEPSPQDERTRFAPRSPYGAAKAYAHHMVTLYREAYGLFACCGILFNHESERRGEEFVTRKIARGAALVAHARRSGCRPPVLALGNLDARRDWGFAGDYVEAMWRMLRADRAADYVVATGVTHSVRDFVAAAFARVGIDDWAPYVAADTPAHLRPAEVDALRGDAARARRELGWTPRVSFDGLVARMVDAELAALAADAPAPQEVPA